MVVVTKVLGYTQTSSAVLFKKTQEILSFDKVYLTRTQRFGGNHVGLSRYCRPKPENLATFSNSCDKRLSITRTCRQLYPAGANHKDATRGLPLDKQNGSLWEHSRILE